MKGTSRLLAIILLGGAICPSWLFAQSDSAALFKSKCALCHGDDGSGATPTGRALKAKDLRSDEVQKNSDAELTEVITKGRNKMPAFGQKLKPDQIQQLVAYIRHIAKK
jgi:mono/diheme cytochrome c family protein